MQNKSYYKKIKIHHQSVSQSISQSYLAFLLLISYMVLLAPSLIALIDAFKRLL